MIITEARLVNLMFPRYRGPQTASVGFLRRCLLTPLVHRILCGKIRDGKLAIRALSEGVHN